MTTRRLLRTARKQFSGTCLTLLALAAQGCSGESPSDTAEPVGQTTQNAYVWDDVTWQSGVAIPVCWEPDAFIQAAFGTQDPITPPFQLNYQSNGTNATLSTVRMWARDAIIAAWQGTSGLTFVGTGPNGLWQECTARNQPGIHVTVFNWPGFTRSPFGRFLSGVPTGVWMNAWPDAKTGQFAGNCDVDFPHEGTQETCVKRTAIHEFGHALGFLHEHSRPENQQMQHCYITDPAFSDAVTVGPYDPYSVTAAGQSYCHKYDHNEGWPSVLDVRALQTYNGASLTQPGQFGHVAVAQHQTATRTTVASIGADGALYSRYLSTSTPQAQPRHIDNWSAANRISPLNVAPQGGGVALAKRGSAFTEELDAFYVGSDGRLYCWKSVNTDSWQACQASFLTPTNFAPPGAVIATDVRNGTELNVFVVANNGAINRITSIGTNAFAAPVAITSASYAPAGGGLATGVHNNTHLDVFAVGGNGAIKGKSKAMTAPLADPWSDIVIPGAAANFAPPGAALATGKQNGTQLDVFVVGNDKRLRYYYWTSGSGWQGPDNNVFPGAWFSAGSKLATVNQGNNLHVYLVGAYSSSGHLVSAWHNGTSWTTVPNIGTLAPSERFLPAGPVDWYSASYALPTTGVAATVTNGATKPTVIFSGIGGLIRAWHSPVPNRYTNVAPLGAFPTPGPHGGTPSLPNEPTRFAPMR